MDRNSLSILFERRCQKCVKCLITGFSFYPFILFPFLLNISQTMQFKNVKNAEYYRVSRTNSFDKNFILRYQFQLSVTYFLE